MKVFESYLVTYRKTKKVFLRTFVHSLETHVHSFPPNSSVSGSVEVGTIYIDTVIRSYIIIVTY